MHLQRLDKPFLTDNFSVRRKWFNLRKTIQIRNSAYYLYVVDHIHLILNFASNFHTMLTQVLDNDVKEYIHTGSPGLIFVFLVNC